MKWYEVRIHTTHEAQEPVTERLIEAGVQGVMIQDPIDLTKKKESRFGEIYELDPADYPTEGIYLTFYLPADEAFDAKMTQIKQSISQLEAFDIDLGPQLYVINPIEEQDWANEWKKYYKPVKISERLTIVPTWEDYEPVADELVMRLDPGRAVGTGTHPTTMQSVRAIETYVDQDDIVIDVGCGSGILSIAACLFGAKKTYALDIDQVAISSTEVNADINGVSEQIIAQKNNLLQDFNINADVIVANILAEIIVQFVDDAWRLLQENGIFITAGIIKKNQAMVTKQLERVGFTIIDVQEQQDWISIVAQKQ